MPRRDSIDGYNNDAIASNLYSLLNRLGQSKLGVTTGKVFILRSLQITNEHATANAVVKIYDEAEAGTPAAPTAANQRLTVIVGPTDTIVLDFTPGLFFKAGCGAVQSGGTINAYDAAVSGYEEGLGA